MKQSGAAIRSILFISLLTNYQLSIFLLFFSRGSYLDVPFIGYLHTHLCPKCQDRAAVLIIGLVTEQEGKRVFELASIRVR